MKTMKEIKRLMNGWTEKDSERNVKKVTGKELKDLPKIRLDPHAGNSIGWNPQ
ncbi:MAG: hypothetical protein Q8O95_00360 [bacterium]|nr:hypothetical protein [bacterium]